MTNQDKIRFAEILIKLSHIYPKEITPQLIDIYWDTLKQVSIDRLAKGVRKLVAAKTDTFYPVPGMILKFAYQVPIAPEFQIELKVSPEEKKKNKMWGDANMILIRHLLKRNCPKRWVVNSDPIDGPIFRKHFFLKYTKLTLEMIEKHQIENKQREKVNESV